MRLAAVLFTVLIAALAVAGCAVRPAPNPVAKAEPRFTSAPVVQRVPAKVVAPEEEKAGQRCAPDIPDEPPLIADKLTGIATYDIGILEQSARELRKALREARARLQECAKGDK